MKGIVLIALGNEWYARWAGQLAGSIHYTSKLPVTLLTDKERGIRDVTEKVINEGCYTIDGMFRPLYAKTWLYELSPYAETLYLDADMIWLPKRPADELFFAGVDFTISCRSHHEAGKWDNSIIHWAKALEIAEKYPSFAEKAIYNISTETMFFRKTEAVRMLFEKAKHFFNDPGVEYVPFGAGQPPDELAFCLAMLQTGIEPHKSPWLPIYWEPFHKKLFTITKMMNEFYGLSIGGNIVDKTTEDRFNYLAKLYGHRQGTLQWNARSKRDFITERKLI